MDQNTVADAFVAQLADRGVEYFFANAGTEFAPLIEAFAKAETLGTPAPKAIPVGHENTAMALAMGVTMVTGKPQVVMVHTNVGTANALCQILNTNRLNLPIVIAAGRSPYAEEGVPGGRSVDIHWTQEMFDQAGMVREAVKWDYELRDASQLDAVVDRALAVSQSLPKGPVYLTLPREIMAQACDDTADGERPPRVPGSPPHPDPNEIGRLAELVAGADNPVIVTSQVGNRSGAVTALESLAQTWAIPVTQYRPRTMNLSTDHEMHFGYDPAPWIKKADLILAVECEVPWIPRLAKPPAGCQIAHLSADPIYANAPHRGFRADISLTGAPEASLQALDEALAGRKITGSEDRRGRLAIERDDLHTSWKAAAGKVAMTRPISELWLSKCLNDVVSPDAIVLREAALDLRFLDRTQPATLFGGASGLGWGLGGAIGAKLTSPDKLVVACEGDGAYMFGNPVAAHQVSASLDAPTLTVIFNNEKWESVGRATRAMYPDGYAAGQNTTPLTYLQPSPDFEKVVETSGGLGIKVKDPETLLQQLEKAVDTVMVDKRQTVVNVLCG